MIKTEFTEMTKVKYPIAAGTMMHISDPKFVAACSEAGGLGILASAMYKSVNEFHDAIKETKRLTSKPFAVNINYFPAIQPADNRQYIKILAEEGVKIVETSGHKAPESDIPLFKEGNFVWIHKCAGTKYAIKANSLGADIITVVGYENGGATGKLDIGTLVLIPRTVSAVSVPVIGGGGVSDGRGLAAALCLGASAAIVGTRLLLSKECPIHDNLKEALLNADTVDTALVMRSIGATHRVWDNKQAKEVLEIEKSKKDFNKIIDAAAGHRAKRMYDEGDIECGIISCGQGIGLSNEILSVKEILDSMVSEAESIIKNINEKKITTD